MGTDTTDYVPPPDKMVAENKRRFVLFPIQYEAIWKAYKHAITTLWIADNVGNSDDATRWESKGLTATQKRTVQTLTVFLATSQKAHEGILQAVCNKISVPEARCFFGYQGMIENVHREALSKISSIVLKDKKDAIEVLEDIDKMLSIAKRKQWVDTAQKSIDHDSEFGEDVLLLVCVQGLFLSSLTTLCDNVFEDQLGAILDYTYKMISVDRETHLNFAILLFYHLDRRPSPTAACELITEIVSLEKAFASEIAVMLDDCTSLDLVHKNIERDADALLVSMEYEAIYMDYTSDQASTYLVQRKTLHSQPPFQKSSVKIVSASEKASFFKQEVQFSYRHPSPEDDELDSDIFFHGVDF